MSVSALAPVSDDRSYFLPNYPMCNGLPFSAPEGRRDFEPSDAISAEIIAEIAASKADVAVCPRIRECFAQCMTITNRHPHLYPTDKREDATDSDHRECDVMLNCDKGTHFMFETILVPPGLLKGDVE